jgi:hypothetical protein
MWVKASPEEILAAKRRRRKRIVIVAVIMWIVASGIMAAIHGWREREALTIVSREEFIQRLPVCMFILGIVSFFAARSEMKRPTKICPKCEAIRRAKDGPVCKCGGRIVDITEVKWEQK